MYILSRKEPPTVSVPIFDIGEVPLSYPPQKGISVGTGQSASLRGSVKSLTITFQRHAKPPNYFNSIYVSIFDYRSLYWFTVSPNGTNLRVTKESVQKSRNTSIYTLVGYRLTCFVIQQIAPNRGKIRTFCDFWFVVALSNSKTQARYQSCSI